MARRKYSNSRCSRNPAAQTGTWRVMATTDALRRWLTAKASLIVDIAKLGQGPGEIIVVVGLSLVKTQVFQQQHVPRGHGGRHGRHLGPHAVRGHGDVVLQQPSEPLGHWS